MFVISSLVARNFEIKRLNRDQETQFPLFIYFSVEGIGISLLFSLWLMKFQVLKLSLLLLKKHFIAENIFF